MQIITRTLAIMSEIGQVPTGLSLQQLADRLDVPVPSLHRLLCVLSDQGFVVRSPTTRRYFLGPNVLSMGAAAARGRRLHQVPPAALTRAAEETGDCFFLTETLSTRTAVCVAVASGKRRRKAPIELGEDLAPGYLSCTRVLLLDLPDERLVGMLGRWAAEPPPGHRALTIDPQATLARIRAARRLGFDIGEGELGPDCWALSVPLGDRSFASPQGVNGSPRQGLTVVTSSRRASRSQVRTVLMTRLLALAHELSRADPVPRRRAMPVRVAAG